MKWLKTEIFRSWPERHSSVAQQLEGIIAWRHQISSDGTRTEQILTFEVTLFKLQLLLTKLIDNITFFKYCTYFFVKVELCWKIQKLV